MLLLPAVSWSAVAFVRSCCWGSIAARPYDFNRRGIWCARSDGMLNIACTFSPRGQYAAMIKSWERISYLPVEMPVKWRSGAIRCYRRKLETLRRVSIRLRAEEAFAGAYLTAYRAWFVYTLKSTIWWHLFERSIDIMVSVCAVFTAAAEARFTISIVIAIMSNFRFSGKSWWNRGAQYRRCCMAPFPRRRCRLSWIFAYSITSVVNFQINRFTRVHNIIQRFISLND